LIASIWAHDRRQDLPISGLVLNSPWLDLQKSWIERTAGTWLVRAIGAVKPLTNIPGGLKGIYPEGLHRSARGEWEFNTTWKPLTSLPVKAGFLATVRAQHARLHKGLKVPVPVLMVRSDKSRVDIAEWDDVAHSVDIVLDVEQMKRWLPSIGQDVTDAPIPGAMHDVMLSKQPVRQRAQEAVDSWLNERFPPR
jgi:alpha-beta hydrolase superfamily lysophospholipase